MLHCILTFATSVLGRIVGYYICRLLDRLSKADRK